MNVHNTMEELVIGEVNNLFDAAIENKAPWLSCSCPQCRLDTICYVLNRVAPRYIKSGRGLAHTQTEEWTDKAQVMADVNRLAMDGMRQVNSAQRPHSIDITNLPESPVFNFPTFVGRILDGSTFEPVKDLSVQLTIDGEPAESIDATWENPYHITEHTPGTFTFWIKPIGAKKEGIKKVFSFGIHAEKEGFDPIEYYFESGITSEAVLRTAYTTEHSYILPNLHLFPVSNELANMQD